MLQTDMGLRVSGEHVHTGPSLGDLIDNVFGLLRRNISIISLTTIIGIIIGVTYVIYARPLYKADAQIILDTRKVQVFQQQPVLSDLPLDIASVESQMQILQSDAIAFAVVKNLNLASDPTFIEESKTTFIEQFKGFAGWLFSLLTNRPPVATSLNDVDSTEMAVDAIQRNLKVTRVGMSYVIDVNFRSGSSARAAQVANAVADAFLKDQMESRSRSMQRTTAWLQARLGELRDQQRSVDQSVTDFKAKNNIVASDGQTTKQDELDLLNGQLIAARNRTSEVQAKLDRIEAIISSTRSSSTSGAPDPTVSDTLTNPVITRLRDKYLDYAAREAEYSAKYGSNHYAVINLRHQMRELQASILDELRRIAETYKSDLQIAKQHKEDLEKILAEAVTRSRLSQGPLRELQGSADTYRALYEGLLQRYAQSVQEQSSPTTEARLLTPASAPTSQSGPPATVVAALISIVGFMFGAGIGVFRHMTDRFFRTTDQVEATLHCECISIVPLVKRRTRSGLTVDRKSIFNDRSIMWETKDAPFSRYAEAIRAIKFAADFNGDAVASRKVIGVTSSLPNEGKSTIAGSLALLAADVGAKTILVDCDIRNPKLSRNLTPNAKLGLLDVIGGEISIEQAIIADASTGLAFLPTGLSAKGRVDFRGRAHSNEILSGEAVRQVFRQLREKYEYIVVDLPPIAPIVDVRSTTRFVDLYVFAVEWGNTKVNLAEHALRQVSGIYAKLIGVVLTKTPIYSLGQYQRHLHDYYDGEKFKQYGAIRLRNGLK